MYLIIFRNPSAQIGPIVSFNVFVPYKIFVIAF